MNILNGEKAMLILVASVLIRRHDVTLYLIRSMTIYRGICSVKPHVLRDDHPRCLIGCRTTAISWKQEEVISVSSQQRDDESTYRGR